MDKKELIKIKKLKGDVRGCCIKEIIELLKRKKLEREIQKIEEKIRSYNFYLDLKKIDLLEMYPLSEKIILLYSIFEILNLKKQDIKMIGEEAAKLSFANKTLTKFFTSLKVLFDKAPEIWRWYFDFGKILPIELDENEKYLLFRIENFNVPRLYCIFLNGFFETVIGYVIKEEKIKIEELKCTAEGDKFHEFKIYWS